MTKITTSDYLRIVTKGYITAQEIALLQPCNIKTARSIVVSLCGGRHKKGTGYTCDTDLYLKKYRGTDRRTELRAIFKEAEA